MRVLVVSDVHLKPLMFDQAKAIMDSGQAGIAVQLGDLVDDFGEDFNFALYKRTIDRAKRFHATFPNTLWCIGNHDFGYLHPHYGVRQTGFSKFLEPDVRPLLEDFYEHVSGKIIHKIDGVLFSHAGLSAEFVDDLGLKEPHSIDNVISRTNQATPAELWRDYSPIWVRPQTADVIMYSDLLQVVGHTPMEKAECVNNVLSTDVFSTYSNGAPIGEGRFVILDTKTQTWEYANETT